MALPLPLTLTQTPRLFIYPYPSFLDGKSNVGPSETLKSNAGGIPMWAWIVIGIVALVIVAVIIVVIVVVKKKGSAKSYDFF